MDFGWALLCVLGEKRGHTPGLMVQFIGGPDAGSTA